MNLHALSILQMLKLAMKVALKSMEAQFCALKAWEAWAEILETTAVALISTETINAMS